MTHLVAPSLLDSPPEEAFDRLTRLAARLLGAPVALVTFLRDDRAFFKSAIGLPEPWATRRSVPLSYSFCRHVVTNGAPFLVEDARRDPLMRTSPAVRELRWISYAGVPLSPGRGETVGALCVVDNLPRVWSPREIALLTDLAASVASEIELRGLGDRPELPEGSVRSAARDPAAGVFEASAVPMALIDSEGCWLRVNSALAGLIGIPADTLIGCPAESCTHPADRAADQEAIRLLRAGEVTSYRSEKRLLREGEPPVWVLVTLTVLPAVGGSPPNFHVAFQDISDRKATERELRHDEERYRLAAEATQDALWDWDLLTDRLVWTERQDGRFGYHRAGRNVSAAWWYERLHADDRERIVSGIHAAIAAGAERWTDEYRFRRADGQYARVRDRATVVRDEAGDAVRMVGAVVDASEETGTNPVTLLEQVLDTLPIGVWVLDRDGRIMFGNPAGRTIWGGARYIGLEELDTYRGWWADSGEPIAPEEWAAARAIRKGETSLNEVVIIESFDGVQKTILNSAVPLRNLTGEIVGAILVNEDISDQRAADASLRRSEEQLRYAQKMEAVGQLAGGIAHDFNNLLTGILSYSELLLQALDQGDPLRGDVEQIRYAGQRAAALTRQLLAFSRRQVLQPRVLSLNLTVTELAPMLHRLVGADVMLETELEPGLWYVLADPGQLEQVLVNLVVNAMDAMPHGGTITVTTANVHLQAGDDGRGNGVRPGPYVTLSVRDTGVGMDVPTQARIFDPFFTTKEPGKGTGLGLSTVYGIVEQSGGHIAVESAPGQGATFTIFLPRHEQAPAASVPGQPDGRGLPAGSETLLLVEDEAAVRSSARRLLEHHGYAVLEARHGRDALRIVESGERKIDLVITDLVMPEMGGRELVERLRVRHPRMKVLFMSGYSERTVTTGGAMPPDTGFVEKPFTVEQLIRRTREVLDGRES